MELLFVALAGAIIGIIARYLVPGRSTQGVVLIPALGTAVASVIWVALTWLGWKWDSGWIWWVALGGCAVVCFATDIALSRVRERTDRRMLQTLTKTGAPRNA